MDQSDDIFDTQRLDRAAWSDLFSTFGARFNPAGVNSKDFAGWGRVKRLFGFTAFNLASNAPRLERTCRDVRFDGADHYFVLLPVVGRPTMIHNDEATRLGLGDVLLVDAARPATFAIDGEGKPWNVMSLQLPRSSLTSHLGFEPRGGLYRRNGTPAARLLFEFLRGGKYQSSASSPAESYMRLVVYDLVGALFAPPDPWPGSAHAEKVFTRIKDLIKARLADPDLGPAEVAAETGISLRYVQKLFTQHGSTCSEFIYSHRLEHAARLLHRRAVLQTGQSLRQIAYACGFRDYTHFARRFRRRFGHAPGAGRQIEAARNQEDGGHLITTANEP
jgi:AraC family transcriptional regulator, positive regulator of tynA and feaB